MNDDVISPLPPPEKPISPWVEYDDVSDTLMVYFFGEPEPAVSYRLPGNRYTYLRLDLDTYETIGMQIEGVLVGFLEEHPEFIELARQAGAPAEELDRIEAAITADARASELHKLALVRLMKAEAEDALSAVG
jgi:hypothetical protein